MQNLWLIFSTLKVQSKTANKNNKTMQAIHLRAFKNKREVNATTDVDRLLNELSTITRN